MSSSFGNMWMAPQPEPTQPPKRESSPMPLPMVGLGKDQVRQKIHKSLNTSIFYDFL